MHALGTPRNLGDPIVSALSKPAGQPDDQARDPGRRVPLAWERTENPNAVRLSEGNEVRSDGRQGVGAPSSTDDAGELTQRTLLREGGAESWNCWEERWSRHWARKPSQRNSNG